MIDAIAKAFQEGGLFMYFIALCSAFSLTVILERVIQLFLGFRENSDEIFDAVESSVRSGSKSSELNELVETAKDSPLERMAKAIGTAIPFGPRAILDATYESREEVGPTITQRAGYIGMLANVSTLLGLLGTIIGLIAAFAGVAAADPAMKQQMLATGISVAMNTTAYGLMVAIPCMLAHSVVMARAGRVMEAADMLEQKVVAALGEKYPDIMDAYDEIHG